MNGLPRGNRMQDPENPGPTAKVLFRVVDEDGTINVETLWAYALGEDAYRLDNSPFYAYSVSVGDVVYAPINAGEERPTFQRVLEKSGNRTVRVILDPPLATGNSSDQVIQDLLTMGCNYEGANPGYLAIVIPPPADFTAVCELLTQRKIEWEHADPDYAEVHPEET